MAGAYLEPSPEPSGNLDGRAELTLVEGGMDSDKDKRTNELAGEKSDADDGAIKGEGWSKVDLHERKKTPEADIPSDIEPQGA